jgi:sugar-specific transcriptional regulator TrmB
MSKLKRKHTFSSTIKGSRQMLNREKKVSAEIEFPFICITPMTEPLRKGISNSFNFYYRVSVGIDVL